MSGFVVERQPKGKKKSTKTGPLVEDAYTALRKKPTSDPARVDITVAHSQDFGAIKVSASVTLYCDQDEATINKAGELAFTKARELMEDSWRELTE